MEEDQKRTDEMVMTSSRNDRIDIIGKYIYLANQTKPIQDFIRYSLRGSKTLRSTRSMGSGRGLGSRRYYDIIALNLFQESIVRVQGSSCMVKAKFIYI